jgi:hypothetical protein
LFAVAECDGGRIARGGVLYQLGKQVGIGHIFGLVVIM